MTAVSGRNASDNQTHSAYEKINNKINGVNK